MYLRSINRVFVFVSILSFCVAAEAPVAAADALTFEVENVFSTIYDQSGPNPLAWDVNGTDGIAWDGTGLWVTSCDTMTFAKFDVVTGLVMDEFTIPGMVMADHIAWDGQYLWGNIHSMPGDPPPYDGALVQIDIDTQSVVRTIEVPFRDANSMTPMGTAWDGQYLWTHDPRNGYIYRIDPETEEGKDDPYFESLTYNGNQLGICGISWDEHSCLWVSDLNLGAYFQVVPETGEVVSYLVPPDNPDPTKYGDFRPPSVTKLFTGMSTDGRRVWIVDEIEGNPLVYQLKVNFPSTGPCAHPVENGESCQPSGQPFCFPESVCYGDLGSETCRPRCDMEGQECDTGFACGGLNGDPVCLPTLGLGEPCQTAQPPQCSDTLTCYGRQGVAYTCQPSCQVDSDCADGLRCTDGQVCLPAEKAGCGCGNVGQRGVPWGPLLMVTLVLGLLLGVRRFRNLSG